MKIAQMALWPNFAFECWCLTEGKTSYQPVRRFFHAPIIIIAFSTSR